MSDAEMPEPGAYLVPAGDDSIVVRGTPESVQRVLMWLAQGESGDPGAGRLRAAAADAGAIAATGAAVYAGLASSDLVRLTPRAMQLLTEHGAQLTPRGTIWSFVREGKLFAGNLDFTPASFTPQAVASVQTLAVSMALKAAIADVEAAVERVEDKVEDLRTMVWADRVGVIAGAHRELRRVVDLAEQMGGIADDDWAAVAHLRTELVQSLETLRKYVTDSAKAVESERGRERVGAMRKLVRDNKVREALALILVAEHAIALWYQARLLRAGDAGAQVALTEEVRAVLDEQRRSDRELVQRLGDVAQQLLQPGRFAGITELGLHKDGAGLGRELEAVVESFARQRHVELDVIMGDQPTLREGLGQIAQVSKGAAGAAVGLVKSIPGRVTKDDARSNPASWAPPLPAPQRGTGADGDARVSLPPGGSGA